jgi:hypothetical protein
MDERTIVDKWDSVEVVVPVDGMSADTTYAEQYTAWHLANAPILGNHVRLTRCYLVRF